jgi:hypothetical protein
MLSVSLSLCLHMSASSESENAPPRLTYAQLVSKKSAPPKQIPRWNPKAKPGEEDARPPPGKERNPPPSDLKSQLKDKKIKEIKAQAEQSYRSIIETLGNRVEAQTKHRPSFICLVGKSLLPNRIHIHKVRSNIIPIIQHIAEPSITWKGRILEFHLEDYDLSVKLFEFVNREEILQKISNFLQANISPVWTMRSNLVEIKLKGIHSYIRGKALHNLLFNELNIPTEGMAMNPQRAMTHSGQPSDMILLRYASPPMFFCALDMINKHIFFDSQGLHIEWEWVFLPDQYIDWCHLCEAPHHTNICEYHDENTSLLETTPFDNECLRRFAPMDGEVVIEEVLSIPLWHGNYTRKGETKKDTPKPKPVESQTPEQSDDSDVEIEKVIDKAKKTPKKSRKRSKRKNKEIEDEDEFLSESYKKSSPSKNESEEEEKATSRPDKVPALSPQNPIDSEDEEEGTSKKSSTSSASSRKRKEKEEEKLDNSGEGEAKIDESNSTPNNGRAKSSRRTNNKTRSKQ